MGLNKYYWTMRDGTKIDVDKMEEKHLRNVLKLLIKRNNNLTKHNTKKKCGCGCYFDGIECFSCGFDASDIDIY